MMHYGSRRKSIFLSNSPESLSRYWFSSKGMVLPVTLLLLLILTFPGVTLLYMSYSETLISKNTELDALAFYRAETGITWAIYWFNHPSKFNGSPVDFFFRKRQGNTSYLDTNGISQYKGTRTDPDITIHGEDFILKIYGPFTPGAVCSIESTGPAGRMKRTVKAELFDDTGIIKLLPGSWRVD